MTATKEYKPVLSSPPYYVYNEYHRKRVAGETQYLEFVFWTGGSLDDVAETTGGEHFAVMLDGSFMQEHWDPTDYPNSGIGEHQGRGVTVGHVGRGCGGSGYPYQCRTVNFEHWGGLQLNEDSPPNVAHLRSKDGQANRVCYLATTNCADLGTDVFTMSDNSAYTLRVEVNDTTCTYWIWNANKSTLYRTVSVAMAPRAWQKLYQSSIAIFYVPYSADSHTEFEFCAIRTGFTS